MRKFLLVLVAAIVSCPGGLAEDQVATPTRVVMLGTGNRRPRIRSGGGRQWRWW